MTDLPSHFVSLAGNNTLFLHQVHHRGQVHDMLSPTDVAPPQLDEFFLDGDEPLRRDELRELGL